MVIKWNGSAQHTDWGLVRPGDVIDTAALGIPDSTVGPWIRDGYAVEVKQEPEPEPEARPRTAKKKANR
jgi:hypothetical protein